MSAHPSLFTDIRKTALLMFATTLPTLLMPLWNGSQEMLAVKSRWAIATLALALLYTAILPAFYFALYCNTSALRFPRHIKTLSLITALVFGFILTIDLWQWINYVLFSPFQSNAGGVSVLAPHTGPWTRLHLSAALSVLSSTAYVILLIAFSRQPEHEPVENYAPVSRFLIMTTKVALIAYALWVAFNVLRLALTPYTYHLLSTRAQQIGQPPPPLRPILATAIRSLISQACLFVAPFIVHNRLAKDDPT